MKEAMRCMRFCVRIIMLVTRRSALESRVAYPSINKSFFLYETIMFIVFFVITRDCIIVHSEVHSMETHDMFG